MKNCFYCNTIKEIKKGTSKVFLAELKHSYVILHAGGQYFKGYCILFTKSHKEHTHKLPLKLQMGLYKDMMQVVAALKKVCSPDRFNYENLGNICHHIHWHIAPRYKNDKYKQLPIWQIPEKVRPGKMSEKETEELIKKLKKHL